MSFFDYIIDFVESLGYLGIFIMTVVEGTLIPIPNEITMIPAGYLVANGKMKLIWVILAGVVGNLVGGLITYYIAYNYGRNLLAKYGKYLFFTEAKLAKVEQFFAKHGPISIAIGRIMPGLKHFISFPAGLAKMDLRLFTIFTIIGGGIWIILLVLLGYFLGDNEAIIGDYLKKFQWIIIAIVFGIIALYWLYNNKRK
jgi:membrane protein DedA with SNARE-associated domain